MTKSTYTESPEYRATEILNALAYEDYEEPMDFTDALDAALQRERLGSVPWSGNTIIVRLRDADGVSSTDYTVTDGARGLYLLPS